MYKLINFQQIPVRQSPRKRRIVESDSDEDDQVVQRSDSSDSSPRIKRPRRRGLADDDEDEDDDVEQEEDEMRSTSSRESEVSNKLMFFMFWCIFKSIFKEESEQPVRRKRVKPKRRSGQLPLESPDDSENEELSERSFTSTSSTTQSSSSHTSSSESLTSGSSLPDTQNFVDHEYMSEVEDLPFHQLSEVSLQRILDSFKFEFQNDTQSTEINRDYSAILRSRAQPQQEPEVEPPVEPLRRRLRSMGNSSKVRF